jgi:HSP20 family protein
MLSLRPYRRNENQLYYNPFSAIDELERHFFGDNSLADLDVGGFRTDIKDNGDSYLLEADLPGFDKDNIHLELNDDTLSINAERHSEHEEKDKQGKYIRCERSYGAYNRKFDVSGVDTAGIKAKYENGVLTLTMPKKNEAVPETKTLQIE